jgi:hypothetical protein
MLNRRVDPCKFLGESTNGDIGTKLATISAIVPHEGPARGPGKVL